jgi:hypothetical protein
MRGFALRKPGNLGPALESAARTGIVAKSPSRAGGGSSSLGVQAGIEAPHRPLSGHSGHRPGLSAQEAGPGRASETGGLRGFGARTPAGSLRGSPRTAAYRGAWLGTVRGPSSAANAPRRTARLKRRAAGRSATHSGLTRRSTGTRRRVLWFQPRGAAGPVNLDVRCSPCRLRAAHFQRSIPAFA